MQLREPTNDLTGVAEAYLMSGSGYNTALARLRDIAQLTGRTTEAETVFTSLRYSLRHTAWQWYTHEPSHAQSITANDLS
ncbi:MAG: hypothetical protein HC769_34155 [Cyanobacteria bacterium CRU_2_1]|nr:hypothetical protein [Cyanobacteria bacterium CRU_2_1]